MIKTKMKKVIRNGKVTCVARNINNIQVYTDGSRTVVSQDFNYGDWMDICTGLKLRIKNLKKRQHHNYESKRWAEVAVSAAVAELPRDKCLRVAYLALRVLVPSKKTFHLTYMMIFGKDYNPQEAQIKNFDELLEIADEKLVKAWYREMMVFVIPLLKEVFKALKVFETVNLMVRPKIPLDFKEFILALKEEIKLLPVYWTDFKGKIIDGEIYYEPWPGHLPPIAREVQWKGPRHIGYNEISTSQICDQGGSFGPICLSILDELLHYFVPLEVPEVEIENIFGEQ